jgi:hypothetical protein
MREIKFRAIRDDMGSNHFVYGCLVYDSEGTPRILTNAKKMLFTTCLKGTEGQFTGLLDKNGWEIYEGDIVKISLPSRIGLIIFEGSGFGYEEIKSKYFYKIPPHFCEIIGNKFENPKLLR